MKKWIFAFFTLILCLGFANEVDAINCIYRSEAQGVDFAVYNHPDGNYVYASPLNEFTVSGETKGPDDFWMTDSWPYLYANLKVAEKGYDQISKDDECYNFMYYDAVVGSNKIYFSDNDTIDKNYDIKLELLGPYENSKDNAILKEMFCNYESAEGSGSSHTYFSFKITHDGNGNGTYELFDDYGKLYSNSFTNYSPGLLSNVKVKDHFSIRIFWNEDTGQYVCPEAIYVGVDSDLNVFSGIYNEELELGYDTNHMNNYTDSTKADGFLWSVSKRSYLYDFYRSNETSYIYYDVAPIPQSEICNYSREGQGGVDGDWHLALTEYKPNGKDRYFATYFNEPVVGEQRNVTSYSVTSGILDDSCEALPFIYTDCLNVEPGESCTVSETEFSRKDSSGNELVEKLEEESWRNSQDIKDAMIGMGELTGYKYKQLMCELYDRLKLLPTANLLGNTSKLSFYDYNGENVESLYVTNLKCSDWQVQTDFECSDAECKEKIEYYTEKKIREITSYCNNKYSSFDANKLSVGAYKGRMEECISFNEFYSSLVANGIIRDLSNGCSILSNELVEKLIWFLDIIKIAGPLLALGLGTLDFIRTVASGDADKEMKNTFKRFSTRLISAALLFLVPFILAFLMDMFLGNQNGYDVDNPFCGVVDFKE